MQTMNPARAKLLQTFGLDAKITRGKGSRLYDDKGREYLDFLAQYGALPFGHNPPQVWAALNAAQRDGMASMVQPLRSVEAERLADRLAEITPGDLSITTFTNSGAETVEAAIKLARLKTGKTGILSTLNGFHGKTMGALSATGKPLYQEGFAAPIPGFDYVPFGCTEALRERLSSESERIAAFIIEPIQGEGGVVCPSESYIDEAIALCRSFGVLFILDEIQTGLGRTGQLFACSTGTEVPDMLLLAKALGGGMMPIGACIVRPSAWDDRFGRLHSSTFANNNLACCAANAALECLLSHDRAIIRKVGENGLYMRSRLEDLQAAYPDVIREVRGRGYMIGVEFHRFDERSDSATMAFSSLNGGVTPLISSYLFNVQGVLTAPLFNETHVMRLQPALTAGRAEIDQAIGAITAVCKILHERDFYSLVRHLVVSTDTIVGEPANGMEAPPAPPKGCKSNDGQFAFLIHYTEEQDIYRSDPSFKNFSEEELANWCEWVKQLGPGLARRMPLVKSRTGATADGWIMSVPMLPKDMRGGGRTVAATMIREAADMASRGGASRLGLGAFTSIVTRGGELATGRGVPVTSGNTLTTISAVKGIEKLAQSVGMPLEDANVVVIGASGAIGRLASMMLARRVGRLSMIGNSANPFSPRLLARVADEVFASLVDPMLQERHIPGDLSRSVQGMARRMGLSEGSDLRGLADRFQGAYRAMGVRSPVDWKTSQESALAEADIVLVATSSEMALIDPRELRPGVLVCDIARPPNVAHDDLASKEVLVFDGGLIAPPFEVDLGAFQTLPKNLCWGCLGETMLLALARETRDFSIGSRLSLADADYVSGLAEEHGFEPAPAQWYGRHLTGLDLQTFAWHVATSRTARQRGERQAQSTTVLGGSGAHTLN